MKRVDHWVLLKWNADGSLNDRATSNHPNWEPANEILGDAPPSAFGRVVLLLNSDQLTFVPWDIRPPVPVWVFSKPKNTLNTKVAESCNIEGVTVVPTPYDTGNFNKHCVDTVARLVQAKNFTDKINKVVWRGALHWPKEAEQGRIAALEFARRHSNETWLDIQEAEKGRPNALERHELAEYRYHLDLGGLSGTSWGGLRWKLCSGLLVFKVEAWANDWWHDSLVAWKHYIPVRADVADLGERYQWTQDHPEETMEIANAGRQKCLETLGPDKAHAQYRSIVQHIPSASQSIVQEADEILNQLILLDTHLGGLSFHSPTNESEVIARRS